MTMLERLKSRLEITDNSKDAFLTDVLLSAKAVILSKRFPFGIQPTEVPIEYQDLQVRIAIEMYNRIGAEGETSHSENGITRSYETPNVSQSLLDEIVPKVGTFK